MNISQYKVLYKCFFLKKKSKFFKDFKFFLSPIRCSLTFFSLLLYYNNAIIFDNIKYYNITICTNTFYLLFLPKKKIKRLFFN